VNRKPDDGRVGPLRDSCQMSAHTGAGWDSGGIKSGLAGSSHYQRPNFMRDRRLAGADLGSDHDRRQGNSIATKDDPVVTDWQFKLGPHTAVALTPPQITAGLPDMSEHLKMAQLCVLVAHVAVGSAVALASVIVWLTQVRPMPVTVGPGSYRR
jgi:hypothetical protein